MTEQAVPVPLTVLNRVGQYLTAVHYGNYVGDDALARIKQDAGQAWADVAAAMELDRPRPDPDHLVEKCRDCHLFVELNDGGCEHSGTTLHEWELAPHGEIKWCAFCKRLQEHSFVHLHRGDDMDEKLDESHQPMPSGRKANLLAWKTYGPVAMRERFVD